MEHIDSRLPDVIPAAEDGSELLVVILQRSQPDGKKQPLCRFGVIGIDGHKIADPCKTTIIGDCMKPAKAGPAIREGFYAALSIQR